MPSFDGGDDFLWFGGPGKGLRLLVVLFEEAIDGGLEIGDGSEHASFQSPLREYCEKSLDGVEPGRRSWGEVESPAGVAIKPLAYLGMFVRRIIIDDGMDRLSCRNLLLDGVEEADEFLMTMTLHVATDHRTVEHVERGEQRRRAVSFVVVRHGSGATLLEWQAGLSAVERLNLAFFVDGQDDGVRGRIDIEPNHVA